MFEARTILYFYRSKISLSLMSSDLRNMRPSMLFFTRMLQISKFVDERSVCESIVVGASGMSSESDLFGLRATLLFQAYLLLARVLV